MHYIDSETKERFACNVSFVSTITHACSTCTSGSVVFIVEEELLLLFIVKKV